VRAWQETVRYNLTNRPIGYYSLLTSFIVSYPTATVASIPATMSKVVRSVKNVTKGYSSVQVKVRNGMRDPLFPVWIFGVNTPRRLHL
jgi:hypothetical protein